MPPRNPAPGATILSDAFDSIIGRYELKVFKLVFGKDLKIKKPQTQFDSWLSQTKGFDVVFTASLLLDVHC